MLFAWWLKRLELTKEAGRRCVSNLAFCGKCRNPHDWLEAKTISERHCHFVWTLDCSFGALGMLQRCCDQLFESSLQGPTLHLDHSDIHLCRYEPINRAHYRLKQRAAQPSTHPKSQHACFFTAREEQKYDREEIELQLPLYSETYKVKYY